MASSNFEGSDGDSMIAVFISKVWKIVNMKEYDHLISWSEVIHLGGYYLFILMHTIFSQERLSLFGIILNLLVMFFLSISNTTILIAL